MQEEISLKDIYLLVKKHFFTMFTLTLVGAIVALIFMNVLVTPKYQSSAQMLVNQRNTEQSTINYNEIQSNIQLINTYRDIITSHHLLSSVSETTSTKYDADSLGKAISVKQSANSQIFTVSIVLDNPNEAQSVLAEITRVFEQTLREIFQNDITNIYVLQPATFNPQSVSPSTIRYLAIGGMIGLVLSILFILFVEMMDTTVKTDDFLVQLGLTNLGEVYSISGKEMKDARLSNRGSRQRKE